MQQINVGFAYLFWCLWLFGLGGIHRFYMGKFGTGILYLFTWGLFGFGQVIDLILIPGMVKERNTYLLGRTIEQRELEAPKRTNRSMQILLKAAQANGGQLSAAQAAMFTELEPDQVDALLREAIKAGYADIHNDPKTGAVRYHFDL
jgi:TM2 domain-containing membrane protein YozV